MTYLLIVVAISLSLANVVLWRLLQTRNKELETVRAALLREHDVANRLAEQIIETQKELMETRKLLDRKTKEVDPMPKRLNGAQLRKLNDQLNNQSWMPERTNSEILKEQA